MHGTLSPARLPIPVSFEGFDFDGVTKPAAAAFAALAPFDAAAASDPVCLVVTTVIVVVVTVLLLVLSLISSSEVSDADAFAPAADAAAALTLRFLRFEGGATDTSTAFKFDEDRSDRVLRMTVGVDISFRSATHQPHTAANTATNQRSKISRRQQIQCSSVLNSFSTNDVSKENALNGPKEMKGLTCCVFDQKEIDV